MSCKIKDEIIIKYPLISKADCTFDCYHVGGNNYIIFWDEIITKKNKINVLNKIIKEMNTGHFPLGPTFIVVAQTDTEFKPHELKMIYGSASSEESDCAVFFLIDETCEKIYMNDENVMRFSVRINKIVRRVEQIVRSVINQSGSENKYE